MRLPCVPGRRYVAMTVAVMPGNTVTPRGAFMATRTWNVCVVGSATCATSLMRTGNCRPGAVLNSATICVMAAERMSAAIAASGTSATTSISSTFWNVTTGLFAMMV